MKTLKFTQHIGSDGVLNLQLPPEAREVEVEVQVLVPNGVQNGVSNGAAQHFETKEVDGEVFRLEDGEWIHNSWPVGYFKRTVGAWIGEFPEIEKLPFEANRASWD